jgi:hypothetical protein
MNNIQPLLGSYGSWIAARSESLPECSFLNQRWDDLPSWSGEARSVFAAHVLSPVLAKPEVRLRERRVFDGLIAEELSWKLPFGPETTAYFLKPAGVDGSLPGILALHDHGANKHFGKRKIADAGGPVHPHVKAYRDIYYGGRAWANEIAKRGYGVLVHDIFPFESRRILPSELPGFVVERMMLPPEEVRELTPEDLASGRCAGILMSRTRTGLGDRPVQRLRRAV